ncbi:hypothetical protein B0H13DRAFT_1983825 [Mycena leptocephala]|nr:hypothetical protein B0H13DRAFT_1983825 [Mycena leptocephala]
MEPGLRVGAKSLNLATQELFMTTARAWFLRKSPRVFSAMQYSSSVLKITLATQDFRTSPTPHVVFSKWLQLSKALHGPSVTMYATDFLNPSAELRCWPNHAVRVVLITTIIIHCHHGTPWLARRSQCPPLSPTRPGYVVLPAREPDGLCLIIRYP